MSTQLPVTFSSSTLPDNWKGTPQQFLDALVARLAINSQEDLSFFVSGSTAPSSNYGPWLKDGTTWYVWDTVTGAYIPAPLEFDSLRFNVGVDAIDSTKYIFWIKLDVSGKAQAINYFSDGAWKDIYEDKFATYKTSADTTAEITSAVASGLATINAYPAGAYMTAAQTIAIDALNHKVEFNAKIFDPSSLYDVATYRYVVPANGIYMITSSAQIDNVDADAATVEFAYAAGVNGSPVGQLSCGVGVSTPTPSGLRWYPQFAGMLPLTAGWYVEIFLRGSATVNSGSVSISNSNWTIHLVSKT